MPAGVNINNQGISFLMAFDNRQALGQIRQMRESLVAVSTLVTQLAEANKRAFENQTKQVTKLFEALDQAAAMTPLGMGPDGRRKLAELRREHEAMAKEQFENTKDMTEAIRKLGEETQRSEKAFEGMGESVTRATEKYSVFSNILDKAKGYAISLTAALSFEQVAERAVDLSKTFDTLSRRFGDSASKAKQFRDVLEYVQDTTGGTTDSIKEAIVTLVNFGVTSSSVQKQIANEVNMISRTYDVASGSVAAFYGEMINQKLMAEKEVKGFGSGLAAIQNNEKFGAGTISQDLETIRQYKQPLYQLKRLSGREEFGLTKDEQERASTNRMLGAAAFQRRMNQMGTSEMGGLVMNLQNDIFNGNNAMLAQLMEKYSGVSRKQMREDYMKTGDNTAMIKGLVGLARAADKGGQGDFDLLSSYAQNKGLGGAMGNAKQFAMTFGNADFNLAEQMEKENEEIRRATDKKTELINAFKKIGAGDDLAGTLANIYASLDHILNIVAKALSPAFHNIMKVVELVAKGVEQIFVALQKNKPLMKAIEVIFTTIGTLAFFKIGVTTISLMSAGFKRMVSEITLLISPLGKVGQQLISIVTTLGELRNTSIEDKVGTTLGGIARRGGLAGMGGMFLKGGGAAAAYEVLNAGMDYMSRDKDNPYTADDKIKAGGRILGAGIGGGLGMLATGGNPIGGIIGSQIGAAAGDYLANSNLEILKKILGMETEQRDLMKDEKDWRQSKEIGGSSSTDAIKQMNAQVMEYRKNKEDAEGYTWYDRERMRKAESASNPALREEMLIEAENHRKARREVQRDMQSNPVAFANVMNDPNSAFGYTATRKMSDGSQVAFSASDSIVREAAYAVGVANDPTRAQQPVLSETDIATLQEKDKSVVQKSVEGFFSLLKESFVNGMNALTDLIKNPMNSDLPDTIAAARQASANPSNPTAANPFPTPNATPAPMPTPASAYGGIYKSGSAIVGEDGKPELVTALAGGGFRVTPMSWAQVKDFNSGIGMGGVRGGGSMGADLSNGNFKASPFTMPRWGGEQPSNPSPSSPYEPSRKSPNTTSSPEGGGNFGGGMTHPGKVTAAKMSKTQLSMMSGVIEAFGNATLKDGRHLSPNQIRALTAEVGRENDFNPQFMFGTHKDRGDHATNLGIISWQLDRRKALIKELTAKGLMKGENEVVRSQEALNTMAQFAVTEMSNKKKYPGVGDFFDNPNVDRDTAAYQLGKGGIKWAYGKIGRLRSGEYFDYRPHERRRNSYYEAAGQMLSGQQGENQSNAQMMSSIEEINASQVQTVDQKKQKAQALPPTDDINLKDKESLLTSTPVNSSSAGSDRVANLLEDAMSGKRPLALDHGPVVDAVNSMSSKVSGSFDGLRGDLGGTDARRVLLMKRMASGI